MSIIHITFLIGFILVFQYLFSTFLSVLNSPKKNQKIPPVLEDIFDREEAEKSYLYRKAKHSFENIASFKSVIIIFAVLFSNFFGVFEAYLKYESEGVFTQAFVFIFGLILLNGIFSLPFSLYETFVIEQKYGFNKTTIRIFLADLAKQFLLVVVFGALILWVIIRIYEHFSESFWYFAWGVMVLFSLLAMALYADIIVPLFNKLTKLEEGTLKDKILTYAEKVQFSINDIYVINGSKRSSKANAFFSGLGPRKKIVLYDTLIEQLEEDEIVAVLAHEAGHFKKKHILKMFFFSSITSGIIMYLFSLFLSFEELSLAIGFSKHSFHSALIGFSLIITPLNTLLGIVSNFLSRKYEYQADAYAEKTFNSRALISGLKKLSKK